MNAISKNHSLISAARVEGTRVYNTAGEHLGHIDDVMLHKISGKIAYAVMSFGGFLGIGEKFHPLPWATLSYDTEKDGYVVPLTRAQLESAPAYERSRLSGDDAEWRENVYSYYGVPFYWI